MPATEKCLGPSLDDTFDRLKGPTTCSLVTETYSTLLIELATGVMLPNEPACHTVLVRDGYVMVKIDHVHQNAESVALDILMIDAEIFTLGDARNTWIK